VPVGYAVDDMDLLLLDEAGDRIDDGRTGQIAVKSRYLSPGYWRDPESTRRRFLPDPDGGAERVYLTGDLGTLRPDGCLHHVGRQDFQVKIRGHRVEPEEVEAALHAIEGIGQGAVISIENPTSGPGLVACYVRSNACAISRQEVRRRLAMELPSYPVPSRFVEIDSLPRTASGKVDRAALARRLEQEPGPEDRA